MGETRVKKGCSHLQRLFPSITTKASNLLSGGANPCHPLGVTAVHLQDPPLSGLPIKAPILPGHSDWLKVNLWLGPAQSE